jgi:glycine cleavage system H lipoate-binding protein/uncharacterized CHY-type Zn-finger protein
MDNNRSNQNISEKRGMGGLNVVEKQCVWMEAGIINFRVCDQDYDCFHCHFDRAMRSAMDAQSPPTGLGRTAGWAETMRRRYAGVEKPCRYYLTGKIGPPGTCLRDYQCDDCPIELELGYKPVQRSIEVARYAKELDRSNRVAGFQVVENECVWMKAGIVNFRICDRHYDCYHCDFDQSMRQAMEDRVARRPDRAESAQEAPSIGPVVTPCIHHLTGESGAPVECERNYECYRCPVHQFLSPGMEISSKPLGTPYYKHVAGYKMAEGYYYHFGHTWVHIVHGECVRVGLDGFVSKVLGAPDVLEIPEPGMHLKQAQVGCVVTRDGQRAPVLSPLTGRVLAVNQKTILEPGTICEDPYQEGWLFQLEPSFLKLEAQALYANGDSFRWMERESGELMKMLGPSYERLAATGGEPVADLFGRFPEVGWDSLVRTFLRTKSELG